ncbi:electron transfer flavoprotein alpha subunit apoprotein [Thermosyntropha lipolytica DSM 11003]|uniref:Electron transfer flavoprotein alpha subunit apoprotein n=1 Tax=Thermosyntropha lipolytica DSM 11003 TaxID=1123382 RepID=A0A1M5KGP8_9FIRM|nr:electron transfer flavoprotein subunit alpha/FixB family protein [Thermosyntropha lipolytica]SHG51875.1 electron transfer flavoprotein alpha subunit apoprotein [Thermosyntropha lipolytica DSM 11003]
MAVLIFSDKANLALELLTAAEAIGEKAKILVINDDEQAEILAHAGAEVYKINNNNDVVLADTAQIAAVVKEAACKLGADIVLLSSNRRGKELAGRLAQKMGAGCLTDVSSMEINGGRIECKRNALGGATVATQYINTDKKVIAVAPRSFAPYAGSGGKVEELALDLPAAAVKVLEVKAKETDTVDIAAADKLVAVGQGLNSKEDLPMIEELAKKIGAEVACSKPLATDKKWLPEERVIGLSGKICKPELAILLGISGQVQFTVGIRDAKVIVAINTDENANINAMADYILTADLHEAVKEMNKLLG